MLRVIGMMYVTLVPTILAGVMVMLWCKLPILKAIAKPIDFGKNFTDGRRIFGDNKTWKGMLGYILFNTVGHGRLLIYAVFCPTFTQLSTLNVQL